MPLSEKEIERGREREKERERKREVEKVERERERKRGRERERGERERDKEKNTPPTDMQISTGYTNTLTSMDNVMLHSNAWQEYLHTFTFWLV